MVNTPITYEQAREIFRKLRDASRKCRRCRGTGIISVRHGTIHETDDAEEIACAYHDEDCPVCVKDGAAAIVESALAEASDEVCVCGFVYLAHVNPSACKCGVYISRRAFLERELEEHGKD